MPAYKQKNGTWIVKLSYLTWDGKRKWLTKRGFETKREALSWENQFKLRTAGTLDMTLSSFIDLYMKNMKERIKPDTFYEKTMIYSKWITPYLGERAVNKLTTTDVLSWQNMLLTYRMPNGEKLSKSYLKTVHNQLSAVLNYAVRYYELPKNVAAVVGNLGTDKEVKGSFWTTEEYRKFALEEMAEPMYYYAFEVLYWAGLREGELLALTPKDIHLDEGYIDINKTFYILHGEEHVTSPNTDMSIRKVEIPEFLVDELRDYMKMIYNPQAEQRLFPLTKSHLTKHIKSGAAKAGVHQIRVHDLRHSHVSLLIHEGFSALEIGARVGHSSVYITFHYAHLFPNAQRKMAGRLDDIQKEVDDE